MFKIFRIIFSVLAAIVAAGTIFVFVYAPHWAWGLLAVGVCAVFAGLMIAFKNLQEKQENKKNPPPPKGDFITGRVETNGDANKENKD